MEKRTLDSIYKSRINDFRKIPADSKKTLIKPFSLFSSTKNAPCYGGTALGAYNKKSTKGGVFKLHYLTKHKLDEYFALEILLRLGIDTPKARIVQRETSAGKNEFYIATQGIVDYIPMLAVRHDKDITKDVGISKLKQRYRLDIEKQVVYDTEEKQEYKISGNLFGSDVAGILIGDDDFQSDRFNLGLVRIGNRFYAKAIDKDQAQFTGLDFEKLLALNPEIASDTLYSKKTVDQTLAIVYEIEQALKPDKDTLCDFDRIFLNPRVINTQQLAEDAKEKCENFKKSAFSALAYYKKQFGEHCLKEFAEREKQRNKVVDAIFEKILLPESIIKEDLRRILVEDLRGPYYQNKNYSFDELIHQMGNDVSKEFTLFFSKKTNLQRRN